MKNKKKRNFGQYTGGQKSATWCHCRTDLHIPKPSCGVCCEALAWGLQIKSGEEEWMGEEEQKALTAVMGWSSGGAPQGAP